jgi:hypothetical protein
MRRWPTCDGRLISRTPASTTPAATARRAPSRSPRKIAPISAPKTMLVSRSAAMGASAPLVCAHSTIVYAASEMTPPLSPETADARAAPGSRRPRRIAATTHGEVPRASGYIWLNSPSS